MNFVNEGSITSNNDGVNNNPGALLILRTQGPFQVALVFLILITHQAAITNLYNNQGAATSDPLTLTGNLPTNYFVTIDSTTDYGQLSVTSGSGNINFGITEGSVIGVPTATQITYSSAAILNPMMAWLIRLMEWHRYYRNRRSDYTVTGPSHILLVDEAESFNLTINRWITAKNEKGSIAGATYESVLAGVSASQIASETTKTVELDGTDVTFTLAETSTSGTWDLSTQAISDQSGQVVHIDKQPLKMSLSPITAPSGRQKIMPLSLMARLFQTQRPSPITTDATIRSDSTA